MSTKPNRLKKGDTIGVISPSSPSFYKSDIVRGRETLESWGYNVIFSKNLNKYNGFVAGTEPERADDLHEMFKNEKVDAVFVTQGGYGSAKILQYLDFELIKKNLKIFIGFSDITALHLAIHKKTGLVTFHGPGLSRCNSTDLTDYTKEYMLKALTETEPIGEIRSDDEKKWINVFYKGCAEGELIGGNMTLVCSSLGTPYEIETEGKILLLEEVNTEPWVIDHMLSHLYNAGKLQKAAGIIIGECYNCEPRKHEPVYHAYVSLEDVLDSYLKPLKIPAMYGLPLGHATSLATIPFGVQARLDATNKKFIILESGVKKED